jgi:serine/threonine-protein kinase
MTVSTNTDRLNAALAGRYRIEKHLGEGGMATVYLAEDLKHKRRVAIKLLKPELAAVLGAERFVQEITTTASLQHPHILPLFDSGTADGFLFYVMPFIEGETLREKLNRETQLGVEEAVRIAREVADALDYAHRHGVIHRDIKPENILLHDGRPMVADFGIALAVSAAAGGRMTETGLSLGTPHYMSPEQATAEKEITARSDVYSLGSVLFEMLTGNPPHVGANAQQIIMKIISEPAEPVTKYRRSVPPNVAAAVAKAVEKLPADRFESAKAFADALANATFVTTVGVPGAALGKRAVPLPVFAATATLAIVATVFALWSRRSADETPRAARLEVTAEVDTRVRPSHVAISPDGRLVVFTAEQGAGGAMLFVRAIDDLTAHPIPGTENSLTPFFSPDGRWLAFVQSGVLKKVPLAGGSPIPLAPVPSGLIRGGTWTKSDVILLGTTQIPANLIVVPVNGGTARPAVSGDPETTESWRFPLALDDGNTVLFMRWRGSMLTSSVGVLSLDKGTVRPLDLPGGFWPLGVVDENLAYLTGAGVILAAPFDEQTARVTGESVPIESGVSTGNISGVTAAVSRSGSLIYQTGNQNAQLVLLDRQGRGRQLTTEARPFSFPRFSPDGKRIAVGVSLTGSTDIWIYDLVSGSQMRLTSEGISDRPEWTADGKRIAYYAQGRVSQPRGALWWQPADGSGVAEPFLTHPAAGVNEGAFSRDGKAMVFRLNGGPHVEDLFYRRLDGDTTPKPIAASAFIEHAARISPDGRWVAYASDQSGQFEVYVRPLPELGARHSVSTGGGATPVWAPDGRSIYYISNGRIHAATVSTSPTFSVIARQQLFEGNYSFPTTAHASYDAAPDGQHLLLIKPTTASSQTVVVHDWKYTLRRRLAQGRKE